MSGGISALYILDKKGRVLISRNFKPDISTNIHDVFNKKMMEYDDFTIKPIIQDKEGNIFFIHRHHDLVVFAVSKQNNNAVMIFQFLYTFIDVLEKYLKTVEQESVRDNFVIIYELLDEMMDNGYPQSTEYKLLKEYIKTQSYSLASLIPGVKNDNNKSSFNAIGQMTTAISWRQQGIKYSKNQFFLDVTEKLSMLVGTGDQIIKSQIIGFVKGSCQLSGMPDLKLGLNDKAYYQAQGRTSKSKAIEFNDIKFHQCVRLGKFESQRMITFVPPDGQFELMSYRLEVKVKPLFSVQTIVEFPSSNRIKFLIKVKSNYKEKSVANNVQIFVPVPEDVQTPSFKAPVGTTSYVPQQSSLKWAIKQFPGRRQHVMTAEFKLPTIESPNRQKYKKMPINVKFEIPYFTVSGFQVRYLKVTDKSGYKAFPFVRYLTQNGTYHIRTN